MKYNWSQIFWYHIIFVTALDPVNFASSFTLSIFSLLPVGMAPGRKYRLLLEANANTYRKPNTGFSGGCAVRNLKESAGCFSICTLKPVCNLLGIESGWGNSHLRSLWAGGWEFPQPPCPGKSSEVRITDKGAILANQPTVAV